MKYSTLLVSFLLACVIQGCTVEECGTCGISPKVMVRFDPSISRKSIETQLAPIYTRIKSVRDSLNVTTLTAEKQTRLTNELNALKQDSTTIGEPLNLFRNYKAQLSTFGAVGASGFEIWQDTIVTAVGLPVDMQHDTTTFYFTYHGRADTLQVYYTREIIQSIEGMRMSLKDIGVNEIMTTFDSLSLKCTNRQCTNDRATIYIYF